MAAQDRARLISLLNTPGITSVVVKNVTTGELTIIAVGPGPMDMVNVRIDGGATLNLLEFAVAEWWLASTTLLDAVDNNWLSVPDPDAPVAQPPSAQPVTDVDFIPAPANPVLGDLLYWNGVIWALLPAGTLGYVLTSNGPLSLPSYQPSAGGGGGGGDALAVTGQTTTGLTDGDVCYISANNTWLTARSDGSRRQATISGAHAGTAGTMVIQGRIAAAKFTTAGGTPTPGEEVYLAANADDGGTGAGKLTAAQPSSGFLTVAGTCLNNTAYAGSKTSIVLLNPQSPIELL